ncbi:MAG: MarR family winged helix-turn-helix transcriptional regulator [Acidimicrobiales bacterium]
MPPEPAPVLDDQRITAFGMLLEAHAAVVAAVGDDLGARSGLTLHWLEVLIRLARTPGRRLRMHALAAQVALSTSGLTRLVDQVEAAGLVRRESCPSDRRGAFAVLTEAGGEALAAALPGHLASLERHLAAPLGPEPLDHLVTLLRTLRDARTPSDQALAAAD